MNARQDFRPADPDALINAEWEQQPVGTPEFEDRIFGALDRELEENGVDFLVDLIKAGLHHHANSAQNRVSAWADIGEYGSEIVDVLRMRLAREDYEAKVQRFIHGETF